MTEKVLPLLPVRVLLLLAAWLGMLVLGRFWALDSYPPGFYVDEAAIAAQVMCVRETGADAFGHSWPLYAPVLGGGQASAPTLYLGAIWSGFFGDTTASYRGFAAAMGLLVLGSSALAVYAITGSRIGAALTVLIGASSPWLFHLSRVFWDPIVAAGLWALALGAYWYVTRIAAASGKKYRVVWWTVFAMGAAAAVYAYPPVRVQVVLSLVLLAIFDREWRNDRVVWLVPILLALFLGPLLLMYADADFRARGDMLAIWSDHWLRSQGKTLADVPMVLLSNIMAHLHPSFLIFDGDRNLRHATGFGGMLGAVEVAVLVLAAALLRRASREAWLLGLLVLAGIIPAAMTWESIPHGLRALGATGPLVMLIGVLATQVIQAHPSLASRAIVLWLIVSVGATILYLHDYTGRYSQASRAWFDADIDHLGASSYPALARLYFKMANEGHECKP